MSKIKQKVICLICVNEEVVVMIYPNGTVEGKTVLIISIFLRNVSLKCVTLCILFGTLSCDDVGLYSF